MSKIDKLITRIKSHVKDLSWDELSALLKHLGFRAIQGSGSRIKFYHPVKDCLIQLHRPHPAKIVKSYMIREVLRVLIEEHLI